MTEPAHDARTAPPILSAVAADENAPTATGGAPPIPQPFATVYGAPVNADAGPAAPQPGDQVDDFVLVRLLGAGSFGRVFLARQASLNRLVALKITAGEGDEARTLARLEHENIVAVFSEVAQPQARLRLLCMQYVPGTTLARVIETLRRRDRHTWNGRAILDAIDAASTDTVALDPAALRGREFLAGCDFVEAACWLGSRLAEALAHAHRLGVLHRDIKPANVLLNQYGRPLLADFNIASVVDPDATTAARIGGTLAYMAPEHLDAFLHGGTAAAAVQEPADVYSLGMVLFELLCGCRPGAPASADVESLRGLARERRLGPPPLPAGVDVPGPVAAMLRRCLDPVPAQRYQSAQQLARTLDGCRELRGMARALPPAGPLLRAVSRWPMLATILLLLLPHVIGGAVNNAYRAVRIVDRLTPAQQSAYHTIVPLYIGVMIATCVLVVVARLRAVRHVRQALAGPRPPTSAQVDAARRTVLRLPLWCVALASAAWLPGGLVLPLYIDRMAGPLDGGIIEHFLICCTISGLIALTYSYFAAQFVVLRFYYPMLWLDAPDVKATARAELAGRDLQMTWFQTLAVLIPLAAAVLMIDVGPEDLGASYRTFRVLVTALIALGMAGLGVTLAVNRRLQDILRVLTAAGAPR